MGRLCVVLLERNHDHAESLLLQVTICGHAPHICFSPDDCLTTVERLKADAVLMNDAQPLDCAYELARRLQELDHKVSLILRVAQPGDQLDCQRSMESGIKFHLVKPVDPVVLKHALRACNH
jgi:DNA-binding response OmpR family regulator